MTASRRTLARIGSILALAVVVALIAWGRGDDADRTTSRPQSAGTAAARPTSGGPSATASGADVDPDSGLAWVDAADLPPEAQQTLELIDAGGPFPYPGKDGSTFGNFERVLPSHPRGYYLEYTVPTPGSRDRGARRIITGDGGEYYWTADHYSHFGRVRR